ncbi:cupin domain-containing protein [Kitasatospora sp. NBC_01302]|uniref:cupin domain-containing protein n=1 Tax=Kitasatospora sp. NBC_01302 TaxID=2903575 RepID=UPI002E10B96C|nr:cupin domain-containing protein [Kitasatospora sp. NBC_01302]
MTTIDTVVRLLGGDFPAQQFGRTYRHWKGVGDFADLLTWDDLNAIVARNRLEPPRLRLSADGDMIPQHAYTTAVTTRRNTIWHRIEPSRMHAQLADGASLVLDAADEIHPRVGQFAEALERHFRAGVQVNAYASWTPREGFGIHWDDHDTVVVQLEGAKRWRIYGQTRSDPLYRDTEAPEAPTGEPLIELVLRAGDMLYMPRGWWHAVGAVEGRSLHLTCGIKSTTGSDLITWIGERVRTSDAVRATLPIHASPSEQAAYLDVLRKEITAALHDGVIPEYMAAGDAIDVGRPAPSLPNVETIPADPALKVHFTTARARVHTDEDGLTVLTAGGEEWRLASRAIGMITPLVEGESLTIGELSDRSGLPVDQVAELLTALVAENFAAVGQL